MPEPGADRRRAAVAAWLASAESDLAAAKALAQSGSASIEPMVVAFHAQQGVEKGIKAWLLSLAIDFRPTHDLAVLIDLLPPDAQGLIDPRVIRLTQYAVTQRYPATSNDPLALIDGPDRDDAEAALSIAESVLDLVRRKVLGSADEPDPVQEPGD